MKYGLIYIATNKINNKSYIGQSVEFKKRLGAHKNNAFNARADEYNSYFSRSIRKYGWDNFEWKVLYDNIPEEQLNIAEICAIYTYDTFGKGYNMTEGGNKPPSPMGKKHTENTKIKLSEIRKGNKNPFYGKRHSIESLEKQSEKQSKLWKITKPNGSIEIIKNLAKYCRDNNLDIPSMIAVSKNRRKHHKNYGCQYA